MKPIHRITSMLAAGGCLAFASCATGGRSPSGFLSNYSQLDAGYGTANAVAVYAKPGADLKKYDSVIIDPVTTVVAAPEISPAVKDQLAAYLADSLRANAPRNIKVVSTPGPSTLRVRTALTDVIEGARSSSAVTTVHAHPKATLSGKLGSQKLAAFISSVSFESEVLDSATGERIGALVDHRMGAKREATAATSWASVRSAAGQGAARLWQRFSIARGN